MTKDDQKKVCKWVWSGEIFTYIRNGWQQVLDDDGVPILKTDDPDGKMYHYMVRDE